MCVSPPSAIYTGPGMSLSCSKPQWLLPIAFRIKSRLLTWVPPFFSLLTSLCSPVILSLFCSGRHATFISTLGILHCDGLPLIFRYLVLLSFLSQFKIQNPQTPSLTNQPEVDFHHFLPNLCSILIFTEKKFFWCVLNTYKYRYNFYIKMYSFVLA